MVMPQQAGQLAETAVAGAGADEAAPLLDQALIDADFGTEPVQADEAAAPDLEGREDSADTRRTQTEQTLSRVQQALDGDTAAYRALSSWERRIYQRLRDERERTAERAAAAERARLEAERLPQQVASWAQEMDNLARLERDDPYAFMEALRDATTLTRWSQLQAYKAANGLPAEMPAAVVYRSYEALAGNQQHTPAQTAPDAPPASAPSGRPPAQAARPRTSVTAFLEEVVTALRQAPGAERLAQEDWEALDPSLFDGAPQAQAVAALNAEFARRLVTAAARPRAQAAAQTLAETAARAANVQAAARAAPPIPAGPRTQPAGMAERLAEYQAARAEGRLTAEQRRWYRQEYLPAQGISGYEVNRASW
jgi:hypothetical protein